MKGLLQMLRLAIAAAVFLGALLALLVKDLLPEDMLTTLLEPFAGVITVD